LRKHQERGFSLIETVVASAILSFVLVALGSLFISIGSLSKKSDYIQYVIDLQNELLRSINTLSCKDEADQSALLALMKATERTETADVEEKNCNLVFQHKDGRRTTLQRNQENLFLFKNKTKDALVLKYNVFAKNGSVYFSYEFKEKNLTSSDPQFASTMSVNLSKFKSNRYEVNEYLLQKLSNDSSNNEICDQTSFARTRDSFGVLRCIKKGPEFSCPKGSVVHKISVVRNNNTGELNAVSECKTLQTIKCEETYSPISFNLQSLTPKDLENTRNVASESKCQLVPKASSIKEFGPYEGIIADGCPDKENFEIDVANSKCVAEKDGDKYDSELRRIANFDVQNNKFSCSVTSDMKKESVQLKVILACKSKLQSIKQAEVSP
jgi:prepilin-type N-terminal cleavage/methylation domain-containing protein